MHFDSFSTMAGRHLAYAYSIVFLVQAGYAGWIARKWLETGRATAAAQKNQRS